MIRKEPGEWPVKAEITAEGPGWKQAVLGFEVEETERH